MKKRLLAWILALVMLAALLPTAVLAEDAAVNPTYVYVTENGKLEDTVKNVYGSSYQANAVTALKLATADGAYLNAVDFAYLKELPNLTYLDFEDADCVSVNNGKTYLHTIPDEALGSWGAGSASTSLKTVILSRKVETMNSAAFYHCTNLEGEVLIPKNIKTMNWYLFGNTKVSKIVFEEGSQAETIGEGAFSSMPNLVSVNLPDTVEKIGNYAFQNSGNFKGNTGDGTMVLPASLKSLGYQALKNTGITKIVFNNAITAIGGSALQCPDLSGRVDIPGSVQTIEKQLLEACSKVEAVSLNEGTTTIAYNALANMAGLKAVYLPSTITSANDWAFREQNAPVVFYLSSADTIAVIQNCYATLSAQRVGTYDMFAVTNGGIFPLATKFESGKLATPIRDGYKFTGWYKDKAFKTPLGEEPPVAGQIYYAGWVESEDTIPDKPNNEQMAVDFGTIYSGETKSETVPFKGEDKLDTVKSNYGYFNADINGMRVTITPKAGLQPGTYTDTLYVRTAGGAVHFITVTVKIVPKPADPEPELPSWISALPALEGSKKLTFTDVWRGDWYYDGVRYVYDNNLMNGTSGTEFSPNAATTRGMIVTILARMDGVNTSGTPWYEAGREWAMWNGISDGTNMEGKITREQLAAMLTRYAALKNRDVSAIASISAYADASNVSNWAVDAMRWAVGEGLIQGSNNTLRPQSNATRAEVATILMRFCKLLKK